VRSDTKNSDGLLGGIFKGKKTALLLLIGIVAGIFLIFVGGGEKKAEKAALPDLSGQIEVTNEYIKNLEIRVEQILSKMDGISDVSVIITADSCAETVYAQNGRYDGGSLTEKEYVIIDKEDHDEPIAVKLVYPKIRGVAVVCYGGSNPINQEKISRLLSSLLDIAQNQVYVSG
jgi:stage III sporulation protein AG